MEKMKFNTGYESNIPFGSDIKIFQGMLERGKEKNEGSYVSYILQLYSHVPLVIIKWFKVNSLLGEFEQEVLKLPDPIQRIQILNKIYLGCRCIDDAIDGDSPQKLSPEEILTYIRTAIKHFIDENWDFNFVPDKYFSKALKVCKKISINIKEQVLKVIESMEFDATRRADFLKTGEIKFMSEKELKRHYYQLDIEGTIGAMLVIVNEENTQYNRDLIEPLGEVMRIYYDIRDLGKEVRQGLINISKEEAELFGITKEMLKEWAESKKDLKNAPQEILNWAKTQMIKAEKLFQIFRNNVQQSNFKKLTKIFFDKQYVKHYEKFKKENNVLLEIS